jgi:hypothetical protein
VRHVRSTGCGGAFEEILPRSAESVTVENVKEGAGRWSAFGRTEYDPASTLLWEKDLAYIIPRLDQKHWLVLTSRRHLMERARQQMDLQGAAPPRGSSRLSRGRRRGGSRHRRSKPLERLRAWWRRNPGSRFGAAVKSIRDSRRGNPQPRHDTSDHITEQDRGTPCRTCRMGSSRGDCRPRRPIGEIAQPKYGEPVLN